MVVVEIVYLADSSVTVDAHIDARQTDGLTFVDLRPDHGRRVENVSPGILLGDEDGFQQRMCLGDGKKRLVRRLQDVQLDDARLRIKPAAEVRLNSA